FADGGDALQADDLEAVGTAEVAVGVVAGDEHALGGGHLGGLGAGPGVEGDEAFAGGGGVGGVGLGSGGVGLGEHAGDGVNAASPEGDVEPDVRVGVGLAGRGEQLVGGQGLGEGADGAAALGEAGEQLAHFAFEVVAVVEDDLGALEFDDVGGGGL